MLKKYKSKRQNLSVELGMLLSVSYAVKGFL